MITQAQKDQIQDYFSTQPVDAVYLFGSHATGRITKLSDTDFAILFSPTLTSDHRFDLKLEYFGKFSSILKSDNIDVLDLSQVPMRFAHEAIFQKNVLYVGDKEHMIDFEAKVTKLFLDFYPSMHAVAIRQIQIIAQHGLLYDPRPNR